MTTASKREELEAAIWHVAGDMRISSPDRVDLAMEAADKYASAFAADILGQMSRTGRESGRHDVTDADAADKAAGQARLEEATAEYWKAS